MKAKKFLTTAFALSFSFLAVCSLGGCNHEEPDVPSGGNNELNIVDDNNRNYYEIFVRSFWDSGNDGVGDLKGVTHQLDYIKEMGYNGIWLMPIMDSTTYHGYDVADYYNVEPDYGTNEDFKELTAEAHKRGINVIIDMVINHSSSANAWFKKATKALANGEQVGDSEDAKYIDYYNFSQKKLAGYNPVNGAEGWYYESRFDTIMPDLNLNSDAVKEEIANIFDFWLTDMDCDGFRLDAVTSYYTDNVTKNVQFLKWVNETAKSIKEDAYIVGEAWYSDNRTIREYYNSGCDSFFLFTVSAGNGAEASSIRNLLLTDYDNPGERFEKLLLNLQDVFDVGILAPFLGNHDTVRAANMLGEEQYVKMGAGLISMMNGSPFDYYGDEIGMTCASSQDETKRVPMLWYDEGTMGEGQVFNSPTQGYHVASSSYGFGSVELQKEDQNSVINYYKEKNRIRNRHPEIARGTIETVKSVSPYVAAIKKTWNNSSVIILINLNKTEKFEVKLSDYGNVKVADTLNVYTKSTVKNGTLTIQPYSIVVLK